LSVSLDIMGTLKIDAARALRLGTAGLLALVLTLIVATPRAVAAEPPVIAAAVSLRDALEQIALLFEKNSGERVTFSFGATGNLLRQIEEGAPFQLFLAADEASVAKLAAGGKTEGETSILVRGRLALAAPKSSPVAVDGKLEGLKAALAAGKVKHFAIANPELAPYGRAAREVLQKADLWADAEKFLVQGENIAQAAQYISSGAAEAGLVAQSLTLAPEFANATTVAVVPEDWYAPVNQGMAVIKGAGPVAKSFAAFLKEPKARAVFEKFGFTVP
jgi:molybdate transport system substrate-binding protein